MARPYVLSSRSILAAAVEEIGGSELVFADVLRDGAFRVCLSFAIPNRADPVMMQTIEAVGDIGQTGNGAQESACAHAIRLMWEDYGYIALDYNLLRVWCCQERHSALLEKLQQSRGIFDSVSIQAFKTFESIQSGAPLALRTVAVLGNMSADLDTIGSAVSCMGFLQMMYVRAGMVRDDIMVKYQGLGNHQGLAHLMRDAGFVLPEKNAVGMKLRAPLGMMVGRIADFLGYNHPTYTFQNRGDECRCILEFSSVEDGAGSYKCSGRFSSSKEAATEVAIYNSILSFSVNHKVEINDTNRAAYVFAKERVADVSLDVEVFGNLGSALCSYLASTGRGLELMITSHSDKLLRHPCGEQLLGKIHSLAGEIKECLEAISGPVRQMNENVVVALLEF